MNKEKLLEYLEKIDESLKGKVTLYLYGSAPIMIFGAEDRISLDIDVAAPYSQADFGDLRQAAEKAGLSINPDENTQGDHIEWISQLRLCLPKPDPESDISLWQGRNLSVKTASIPHLIASKLIRYDEIDQADIQYLCTQRRIDFSDIETTVKSLPPPFDSDQLVLDNLNKLKTDMKIWANT